jgi:hypothetical protein
LLAIIVIALAAASAAANQARAEEGRKTNSLGTLFSLEHGRDVLYMPPCGAAKLAIEEANGTGGLLGWPVCLVEELLGRGFSR